MEYLKLYESYLSDIKKAFGKKYNIISKYINFIEKYDLDFLMLFGAYSSNKYQLLTLQRYDVNDKNYYKIEYEQTKDKKTKVHYIDLWEINDDIINILEKSTFLLDLDYILSMNYDASILISILKTTTDFDTKKEYISQLENDLNLLISTEVQNLMLDKHIKIYIKFITIIEEEKSKDIKPEFRLILDNSVFNKFEKKYPNKYKKFMIELKRKKFNL